MPFGMVLIVDQSHIQDVLAAVVNSPLRIQITEWHWRRCHDDIRPKEEETPAVGTDRPQPPSTPAVRIRPQPITLNPSGPTQTGTGAVPGAEEHEWDLVELAVYGIASLYERYPPPEATAAAPTTTPGTAPAQPVKK